jgi:hypothetical protein
MFLERERTVPSEIFLLFIDNLNSTMCCYYGNMKWFNDASPLFHSVVSL